MQHLGSFMTTTLPMILSTVTVATHFCLTYNPSSPSCSSKHAEKLSDSNQTWLVALHSQNSPPSPSTARVDPRGNSLVRLMAVTYFHGMSLMKFHRVCHCVCH